MARMVIRADGGEIGLGHVMRCGAIASEAIKLGHGVLFAVSDERSAKIVRSLGYVACVVADGQSAFTEAGATALDEIAADVDAGCVLIDSYAATSSFLTCMRGLCRRKGAILAYIDDAYRLDSGFLGRPRAYDVDVVVNYGFGYSLDDYRGIYGRTGAKLLVGPAYAPVREEFRNRRYEVRKRVERLLLTSGSTNPGGALERMAAACLKALPEVRIQAVVGPSADFDTFGLDAADMRRIELVRDPADMASLMLSADLAVSAAGSTLYELACVGVPTIAVPLVENQLANAQGWAELGLQGGDSCVGLDARWLLESAQELARSRTVRERASLRLRGVVDGRGARRVAEMLVGC